MKISGVADTYKKGKWQGLSILDIKKLKSLISQFDVIIISSMYWKEITKSLLAEGIVVDIFLAKDTRLGILEKIEHFHHN